MTHIEITLTRATRSVVWVATASNGRESRDVAPTPTEAVWRALDHLTRGEVTGRGTLRVTSLDGDMVADCTLCAVPTYENLSWRPFTAPHIKL